MSVLPAVFTMLTLPIKLLVVVFQYYTTGGVGARKFHGKGLGKNLRLTVYRTALSLGPENTWFIHLFSNEFLLNRIVGTVHSSITSKLPHYGEWFDENSLWIVKQPDIKPHDPVIIYLHGGGFFLELQHEQVEAILAIYKLLDPQVQRRTSILLLDYKLVCHGHTLPTQLNQLHATYSNLAQQGFDNVSLLGDSAGGNLSIVYLHYLSQLQTPLPPPSHMLLISPWVKLSVGPEDAQPGKSYYDNQHFDMINFTLFAKQNAVSSILGDTDVHSLQVSPGNKLPYSTDDWHNLPLLNNPKSSVFLLVGEDESFRDDVLEWAKYALGVPWFDSVKYGNSHKFFQREHYEYDHADGKRCRSQVYVEPWGIHDSMLFFENHLLRQIKRNPSISWASVDSSEFFGIKRIVKFLNENL